MITRDGYKSTLGGLSEAGREGDEDLSIITVGIGERLAIQFVDDEGATRSVKVSLNEEQVLSLIDDLQKWVACR